MYSTVQYSTVHTVVKYEVVQVLYCTYQERHGAPLYLYCTNTYCRLYCTCTTEKIRLASPQIWLYPILLAVIPIP